MYGKVVRNKYVELHDHDDPDTIWLIWAKGHVSAFDRVREIGVPDSFTMAMNFDPSYRLPFA